MIFHLVKQSKLPGSSAENSELKDKMHFGDLWPFTLQIKEKILAEEYKSKYIKCAEQE